MKEASPFLVHFHYYDPALDIERRWEAYCYSVPRIGERLLPEEGREGHTVVKQVVYRFIPLPSEPGKFLQVIVVLLGDPPERNQSVPSTEKE